MPDLRIYRVALLIAVLLAAGALVALRPPQAITVSTQPTVFDPQAAAGDLRALANDFPGRVAGSAADRRAASWVAAQLAADGLQTHVDAFSGEAAGRRVGLANVWAVSTGTAAGTIVVLAPRDSPPGATQGANDDASGTACLLELASVFAGSAHLHPIVFVSTDGDTNGALGAHEFLTRHRDLGILAVVVLRRVAGRDVRSITLNGWSAQPLLAPPWLWGLAEASGRAGAGLRTPLPPVTTQLVRLAVPSGGGSQGPFVAAGLPAIELSAPGTAVPAVGDTLDTVSTDTLLRSGRAAEVLVASLDAAPTPLATSGQTIFFSRFRQLSGGFLVWILVVLTTPLAVVSAVLASRAVRRRLPLRHAVVRLALRAAPWLLTLALVYLASLLGLLPGGFGAAVSPDALVSHAPHYLRVLLILLFLAVTYHYAMAIEHRLARRFPAETEAIVTVAHLALLLVALAMLAINPFSLALVLPAALLWPIARRGPWPRSALPVWAGLAVVAASLVYLGDRLHLGWDVWWYFFLLLETRTIPVPAVILAVIFAASTALLSHELHVPRTAEHGATDGAPRLQRAGRAATRWRLRERAPASQERSH